MFFRMPTVRCFISILLVAFCAIASISYATLPNLDVDESDKQILGKDASRTHEFTTRTLGSVEKYKVYRIELREAIMSTGVPFFIHRALLAAKAAGAEAIVLDINTPGGAVDLMKQIRDELIAIEVPTYAYVNDEAISAGSLIAISMDKIVMSPHSVIGAAQVVDRSGQTMNVKYERKITSYLLGLARATAKYKKHPVRVCEAFFDSEITIDGLTSAGMVLTMDQEQATEFVSPLDPADPKTSTATLAAYIAEDIDDLLKREGIWPAEVLEYKLSWSESLAKWLLAVRGILLLIGLGAIFVEIKTPGIGVPAAIGVLALALFFWGSYLADLSGVLEVVLLVVGLVLLAIEIFVIPGFGLAGIAGIILIFTSLIMAMIKLPAPNLPDAGFDAIMLSRALWTIIWVFCGFIVLAAALVKILPSTPFYRMLVLNPEDAARAAEAAATQAPGMSVGRQLKPDELIGQTGEAVTDLRPSGTAIVAGRRLDVVTEGEYIMRGTRVRIISIQGNVYTVVAVESTT